jgi:hypothetical protein
MACLVSACRSRLSYRREDRRDVAGAPVPAARRAFAGGHYVWQDHEPAAVDHQANRGNPACRRNGAPGDQHPGQGGTGRDRPGPGNVRHRAAVIAGKADTHHRPPAAPPSRRPLGCRPAVGTAVGPLPRRGRFGQLPSLAFPACRCAGLPVSSPRRGSVPIRADGRKMGWTPAGRSGIRKQGGGLLEAWGDP